MYYEFLMWTLVGAGSVMVVGTVLALVGAFLGNGMFATIWPAAGWMIVVGLLVGGVAGAASLMESISSSRRT